MKRVLRFTGNGRQATKDDLLDILRALAPHTSATSSWSVSSLRAALQEAVSLLPDADSEAAE